MTIIYAYSVFDKTAGTFASPFFEVNDEVAKRNFRFSIKKYDDMFVKDLELYYIGNFSKDIGTLSPDSKYVVDTGENVLCEREIEMKNSEVK